MTLIVDEVKKYRARETSPLRAVKVMCAFIGNTQEVHEYTASCEASWNLHFQPG